VGTEQFSLGPSIIALAGGLLQIQLENSRFKPKGPASAIMLSSKYYNYKDNRKGPGVFKE
jgi:hypothetical protein